MEKIITFAVPCYNSESYMRRCIDSLLDAGEDSEIIIIDDGSKDRTGEIADEYAEKYNGKVRVVHQENGGHGEGVNVGMRLAAGKYYKVVDSDDRLDPDALKVMLECIRKNVADNVMVDMYVSNYVYDHADGSRKTMKYTGVFPEGKVVGWEETKRFGVSQYLMMHSVIYRTELLREIGMTLPKHTFYVDNLYMYQPFPSVKSICYKDIDLYYYFLGRDDQSVSEKNMIKRIDQQLTVTRLMTECHDLNEIKKSQPVLYRYMFHELSMMYTMSTVFLFASKLPENIEKNKKMWQYLKSRDPVTYRKMKLFSLNALTKLPGKLGRSFTVLGFRVVKKVFKCN